MSAERYGMRRAALLLSNSFSDIDSLFRADVYLKDGYRYDSSPTETASRGTTCALASRVHSSRTA